MKRGFEALVVMAIGVVVAIVMLASVLQPVINDQIAQKGGSCTNNTIGGCLNNLSSYSTAQLVANQLPVLTQIALLVTIAGVALAVYGYIGRG